MVELFSISLWWEKKHDDHQKRFILVLDSELDHIKACESGAEVFS